MSYLVWLYWVKQKKEEAGLSLLILAFIDLSVITLKICIGLTNFSVVHTPEWNIDFSKEVKRSVLVMSCFIFVICSLVCLEMKCLKAGQILCLLAYLFIAQTLMVYYCTTSLCMQFLPLLWWGSQMTSYWYQDWV